MTILDTSTGRCITESMSADVAMREFTDAEMESSIASGTPMDKAGAYAIQDDEFRPASMLNGCYPNVMGLPVCRVVEILAELGCSIPDWADMTVPLPDAWANARSSPVTRPPVLRPPVLEARSERTRHRANGVAGHLPGCILGSGTREID